jgi:acetyltransferase-like isoleucine patch superfamily enzyme
MKTHAAVTGGGSALHRYRTVIVGRPGLGALVRFELCMLARNVPGALGLVLRRLLWPPLFAGCGRGVMFASGITLRHPGRIRLGDRVVVAENCILDGRHDTAAIAIDIGPGCILADNVMLQCKGARIRIGADVGIGPGSLLQTTSGADIRIGDDALIGPRCTVIGAGNYNTDRLDVPIRLQGLKSQPGVEIGADVWMGCNVTVLTGSLIGRGAILAAGAVVRGEVAAHAVMGGVPARPIGTRIPGGAGPAGQRRPVPARADA